MSGFLLSEEAELDLDEVWLYVARESGSVRTATQIVDNIYRRFLFLGVNPFGKRSRDWDPGANASLLDQASTVGLI